MKKLISLIMILAIAASFCACGSAGSPTSNPGSETADYDPESAGQAAEVYGSYLLSLGDNIDNLESLRVLYFNVGGVDEYDLTSQMTEVAKMLSNVKLLLPTDEYASDCDEFYTFTLKDGSEMKFHFNADNYCVEGDQAIYGKAVYTVANYNPPKWSDMTNYLVVPEDENPGITNNDDAHRAYNHVIDEIVSSHDSVYNRGSIFDFFGDGMKEMVLLFTPDEKNICAGIYTCDSGELEGTVVNVAEMAGGASAEIYPGWYGKGEETPVFYIIYSNYDGDTPFGSVTAYSVKDGFIEEVYSKEYKDKAEWLEIAKDENVNFGACACEFSEDGIGTPIANLRAS